MEITGQLYAIFRVGEKKYKTVGAIAGYQRHMEREQQTPNANPNISNVRLLGSNFIMADVKEYIEGIKLRKNGVIARDLLLTASPKFFKDLSIEEKQKWVNTNIKFLERHFGENCVYATLHRDETTWHISALVVPRFWEEKKKRYVLANSRYFDGKKKLSKWQDKYSSFIKQQFKELNRGQRGSKAHHVKISNFYRILNSGLDSYNALEVIKKSKQSIALKEQLENVQSTLNKYKDYAKLTTLEKQELSNSLKDIKQDKEVFKETIKAMSEIYKISQQSIAQIINSVDKNLQRGEPDDKERRV
ncbi:MobV family relaxase [Clostridium botulinum]|uniref:Plasmid recombination enzyme n=1 Tax=Clostridium botulinum (strain Langeland / NCTC 10281 / Type F) TaxID=441772 RepID=A7GI47_CLOBL|nr:MobV family relaxase [Clostridium botulinum]ABS39665.1 plasmid recombination enzyme [Clostridium botulinum F str. Langeland]ADG00821.1 plasmid recombination enzyme [Clostridium botulinum F str. 230613]KKM40672.1 recombinase [Clostridium botulinum]MBY6794352.1 plasmid recombination protein [Clostridium botulinum]MBY6938140.1 plasmid recombination protein [Clostridium botulinum]